MICRVCNKENADDATFCSQCGNRLDGKAFCPVCAKEIPADSAFCNYCGVSLKATQTKVAPIAKTAKVSQTYEPIQTPAKPINPNSVFGSKQSIFAFVANTTALVIVAMLFIFSFFFGQQGSIYANVNGSKFSEFYEKATSFSWLIDDIKTLNASLKGVDLSKYAGVTAIAQYAPIIINIVVVALCMILTSIFTLVTAIKYYKYVRTNELKKGYYKYLIASLITYFFTTIWLNNYCNFLQIECNAPNVIIEMEIGLGVVPTIAIIMCSVLVVAIMVMRGLAYGKTIFSGAHIKKYIGNGIVAVMATVIALTVLGPIFNLAVFSNGVSSIELMNIKFTSVYSAFLEMDVMGYVICAINGIKPFAGSSYATLNEMFVLFTEFDVEYYTELAEVKTVTNIPEFTKLVVLSIISFGFAIATFVMTSFTISSASKNIYAKKTKKSYAVFAIITAVVAIIYFIVSAIYVGTRSDMLQALAFKESNLEMCAFELGSAPICAIIFAILLIGSAIVSLALNAKKQDASVNYVYAYQNVNNVTTFDGQNVSVTENVVDVSVVNENDLY